MDDVPQLTKFCLSLGATPDQAETMARQLLKRTDQLVTERGQSRAEAMAYLLRLVVQGRSGETPPEFSPSQPPPSPPQPESCN